MDVARSLFGLGGDKASVSKMGNGEVKAETGTTVCQTAG